MKQNQKVAYVLSSIFNFVNMQPPRRSLDGYKHVVDVEYCPPVSSDGPHFPPAAAKAKEAAQKEPSTQNTAEYHEIMEGKVPGDLALMIDDHMHVDT